MTDQETIDRARLLFVGDTQGDRLAREVILGLRSGPRNRETSCKSCLLRCAIHRIGLALIRLAYAVRSKP